MIDGTKIILMIDRSLYDKVAILKTLYVFQDRCHTCLEIGTNNVFKATLVAKNESCDLLQIERQFQSELIDQQIRLENGRLFSDIRNMIIEQAFKPISYRDLKTKINK
jgi:His-Xaa-Ser system protein HxsD